MKLYIRLAILGMVISVLVLLYYADLFAWLNMRWLKEHMYMIEGYVNRHFVRASFLFVGMFMSAVVLSLPVTIILTISSGYFFGVLLGTVLSIIGATVGGSLVFLVTRYMLFAWIGPLFQKNFSRLYNELKHHGASYLIMLQILPITPSILLNVGAALSPITLQTFAWTAAVGIIPGTLLYTLFGSQLYTLTSIDDIMSWRWILLLCLLALFAILPRLYMYMRKK